MITLVYKGKFPVALEDAIKECVESASDGAGRVSFQRTGDVTLVDVGVLWSDAFNSVLNTAADAPQEVHDELWATHDYHCHVAESALSYVVGVVVRHWRTFSPEGYQVWRR